MKSQVLKNPPYECWGKQDRAVLIEEAMESFLKPEEVFRKVYL